MRGSADKLAVIAAAIVGTIIVTFTGMIIRVDNQRSRRRDT